MPFTTGFYGLLIITNGAKEYIQYFSTTVNDYFNHGAIGEDLPSYFTLSLDTDTKCLKVSNDGGATYPFIIIKVG